ncbi:hypothetical protein HDF17_003402 [Granulicella arctica]|uniref:Uncharacterized protein n=1 Tax=Granulicella arctica TaxID=940613 RepID=A0A7Y9PJK0_9BACT|nr:hypothetical protein [Granulicella arctica]
MGSEQSVDTKKHSVSSKWHVFDRRDSFTVGIMDVETIDTNMHNNTYRPIRVDSKNGEGRNLLTQTCPVAPNLSSLETLIRNTLGKRGART